MKFIAVFLAFVTLSLAQSVFPQFSTVAANTWSQQSFKIQNAATRGPATIITDVYFEVLVLTSDSAVDKLGVFYGYNQPIGSVGAVNGMSNGTGSFYVYGDAGVYSLQVLVTYKQNGQQKLSTQGPFSLTVSNGPVGPAGPKGPREVSREELGDAEVVLESEDFSILKRDGSSTDLSTYMNSASNFYGVPAQMTYNSYYIKVGSSTLKQSAVTYSMVTQQTSVALSPSNNGTQDGAQLSANAIYEFDFSVYGPQGGPWTMQIAFTYRKGFANTAGSWSVQKDVVIQPVGGTNVRSATDLKSFSQIAAESQEAQAKGVESVRFGYALATAGAGVAVVAAVAIVAALVTVRKNRQTTTVA